MVVNVAADSSLRRGCLPRSHARRDADDTLDPLGKHSRVTRVSKRLHGIDKSQSRDSFNQLIGEFGLKNLSSCAW